MYIKRGEIMSKLTIDEFEMKLTAIPEVEPDEWDREMLAAIDMDIDGTATPLETIRARRDCSGKISVRVPKDLHYTLLESAKENGVSLNQFIVYKLAKP
jgi:hypothetical protein